MHFLSDELTAVFFTVHNLSKYSHLTFLCTSQWYTPSFQDGMRKKELLLPTIFFPDTSFFLICFHVPPKTLFISVLSNSWILNFS